MPERRHVNFVCSLVTGVCHGVGTGVILGVID